MTAPRFTVDRRVGAPPDAVAAALRGALADARHADLPPPLRKDVRGLAGQVRPDRFTIHLDDRSEGASLEVHGWLLFLRRGRMPRPRACGGRPSRRDRRRRDARVRRGVLVDGRHGRRVDRGLAAFLGLIALVRQAGGNIDEPRADFLVAWLNGVLDRLPAPSPPPPPLPPAEADTVRAP